MILTVLSALILMFGLAAYFSKSNDRKTKLNLVVALLIGFGFFEKSPALAFIVFGNLLALNFIVQRMQRKPRGTTAYVAKRNRLPRILNAISIIIFSGAIIFLFRKLEHTSEELLLQSDLLNFVLTVFLVSVFLKRSIGWKN